MWVYVELGLAVALFNILTVLLQAPMGFAVDRFDARSILVSGLCLGGFAFILFAAVPTYPCLLIAATLAGIANAVYHPADYSILSATISPSRIGRVFSLHLFAGYFGSAIAPALVLLLATIEGFRSPLPRLAVSASFVAVPLVLDVIERSANARKSEPVARAEPRESIFSVRVLTPTVLSLTGFFALISLSTTGINNFAGAGLQGAQGMSLAAANAALSGFLFASAVGVLAGGMIADRTIHHNAVAAIGFVATAILVLLVAVLSLPGPYRHSAFEHGGLLLRIDSALARHDGARGRPGGRRRSGVRHRHDRLQYRLGDRAGDFRVCPRPRPAGLDFRHHRRFHGDHRAHRLMVAMAHAAQAAARGTR
jgi:sugar phosphate permease